MALLETSYCLSLGLTRLACSLTDSILRGLSSYKSRVFSSSHQDKGDWQPGSVFLLLSLSTRTILLLTNSQFYPEMKSHHFCQESHTETWFCFVSGHTVFDKIFTQERKKGGKQNSTSYKIQYREDKSKCVLQISNPQVQNNPSYFSLFLLVASSQSLI